jgi:hypothetical protein
LSSGVVVVAVVGGVGVITVGEVFNAPPSAHQVTATTVTLTTSAVSPVAPGVPVALTATVSPIAAGTVQFKDGVANLGSPVRVTNGTASGSTSSLTAGSHSLLAVFAPHNPGTYGPSTSQTVTLVVAGASATTTTLATSPVSPAVAGAPVMLTATIAPATAVGTVQFKDGAGNLGPPVTVSNGAASGTTSSLIAGPHQLAAVFAPTDPVAFGPSTSAPIPFVVNPPAGPIATTTTLTTSPASPAPQGTKVTLTATISPATATGAVQFKDGTRTLGDPVPVSNGTASGSTSTLPPGTRSLTAVFIPNANAPLYGTSTSTPVEFVITPGSTSRTTATSTALTTYPGSPVPKGNQVTLIATISPTSAPGTVQFKDGTFNLGNPVAVSNNGTASTAPLTFAPGRHQLTAVYLPADSMVFASSTSPVLVLEVTQPGLADVGACLRVLKDCPTSRADTPWASPKYAPSSPDLTRIDRRLVLLPRGYAKWR